MAGKSRKGIQMALVANFACVMASITATLAQGKQQIP